MRLGFGVLDHDDPACPMRFVEKGEMVAVR